LPESAKLTAAFEGSPENPSKRRTRKKREKREFERRGK